jgi:hypothetical protein
MTFPLGITAGTLMTVNNDIAAAPLDPFKCIVIDMMSTTQELERGQVLKKNVSGTYETCAAADFPSAEAAILLQRIKQTAEAAKGQVAVQGHFIKERITPNTIAAGSYHKGNFIIESEG